MKYLNEVELKEINGGISYGLWAILGGIVTFVIGFLDGITRPLRCR